MADDKRRWGDRRDAKLLRDVDSLHFIMGIIYPNRADNEAYIAERIDLGPIKEYLAKKNVEGIAFKYTFFHIIVTALVKTVTLRPKLNRFFANENYYQRNAVTALTRESGGLFDGKCKFCVKRTTAVTTVLAYAKSL